ncbi:MAG: dTDP-4-dehydrorhamnose 3,5-epimerase family protein, partial [Cetobacterium sp.]
HAQGKLVRVVSGSVYDVAVDLRKDSITFGKWYGVLLTATNKTQFYIPPGFAHGFLTLEDNTEFLYKCTEYYAPEFDSGVLWNDTDIGVDWQLEKYGLTEGLMLSAKDRIQQTFREFKDKK